MSKLKKMEEGDDMQLTTAAPTLPPKALFLNASITMEIASGISASGPKHSWKVYFFSLSDI